MQTLERLCRFSQPKITDVDQCLLILCENIARAKNFLNHSVHVSQKAQPNLINKLCELVMVTMLRHAKIVRVLLLLLTKCQLVGAHV